jgi:homoserine kinase type II
MAALTPFAQDDAWSVFRRYVPGGLAASDVAEPEVVPSGTVNSSYSVVVRGVRWFVRIYEEQDLEGAVGEAARLEALASRGVKTPAPLTALDGRAVALLHGKPIAVFPWRDGEMRCLARVTPEDARRVGAALAAIHAAGGDVAVGPSRFEEADLEARLLRLSRVPFPAIAREVDPLRSKLRAWSGRRDASLPTGLIHGDVFRDNVLWGADGEISAVLDFESASRGRFAYDLMVTLLAWSFRDGLDEAVASTLVAGYEEVRPLEPRERAGLLAEGCFAAIRFTITRLTDAELRAAEAGVPPRKDKDWRRFAMRLRTLEGLGAEGLARVLGR